MTKPKMIAAINAKITEHNLDFDLVPEDTKEKAKDLKAMMSDVEDAVAIATAPPTVTLASIAKAEGKDPKTVRSRMRRLYKADDTSHLPQKLVAGKWTFHIDDTEAVRALVLNEAAE